MAAVIESAGFDLEQVAALASLDRDVVLVGVRHHSPACARHVQQIIKKLRPAAVLIEGPGDFTALEALQDPTLRTPVALFSYVAYPPGQSPDDMAPESDLRESALGAREPTHEEAHHTGLIGRKRYAGWYPFCDYSPEWVALQTAMSLKIPVSFCDLSLHARCWSERKLRQQLEAHEIDLFAREYGQTAAFLNALLRQSKTRDEDELWDHLFEQAPADIESFARAVTAFGCAIRATTPEQHIASDGDRIREEWMAAKAREAFEHYGGPIILICGAFHLAGIDAALAASTRISLPPPLPVGTHAGIHLLPYHFQRMSRLHYAAGMSMPQWYQKAWEHQGGTHPWLEMLSLASRKAREHKHVQISIADLAAAAEMASRLARFRGHLTPSRVDVLDAVQACWVKGDQSTGHGHVLSLVEDIFCGDRKGHVGTHTGDPPLVQDVDRLLQELHLEAPTSREVRLRPIREQRDRKRSQVLSRLAYLGVGYATLLRGPDFIQGHHLHRVEQVWRLEWSTTARAALFAHVAYGATLEDAVAERLRERLAATTSRAQAAVSRLIEACALGLAAFVQPLLQALSQRIQGDNQLLSVLGALHGLLLLYRYRDAMGTVGGAPLAALLHRCWQRALQLLAAISRCAESEEPDTIAGLKAMEHALHALGSQLDDVAFFDALAALSELHSVPGVHGAVDALRWRAGRCDVDLLGLHFHAHCMARYEDAPGRYLEGLLQIARRSYLSNIPLLRVIGQGISDIEEPDFRRALPRLRRVHAMLTPDETNRLARAVVACWGGHSAALTAALPIDPCSLAALSSIAEQTTQTLQEWGLLFDVKATTRGADDIDTHSAEGEAHPSVAKVHSSVAEPEVEADTEASADTDADADTEADAGTLDTKLCASMTAQRGGSASSGAPHLLRRWRLILGKYADAFPALSLPVKGVPAADGQDTGARALPFLPEDAALDEVLGFLYDREYRRDGREQRDETEATTRGAGHGPSGLTVPAWINQLHKLFPRETCEVLEAEALTRYGLEELVTQADVLARCTPSIALLESILRLKHMMAPAVLAAARRIVREVADSLREVLRTEARYALSGKLRYGHPSPYGQARSFDPMTTIRRNLKHYDPERQQILVERAWFRRHLRQYADWRVIVCVDQSGSMLTSTIHAGIIASLFASIRELHTHLIVFDTSLVDLTDICEDPVETLLSIQLGGGTDIAQAVGYCHELVEQPAKTILVLITDLYEGGSEALLLARLQALVESGVKVLVLAALDEQGEPDYDRDLGRQIVQLGAEVAALTPRKLVRWLGEVLG